MLVHQRVLNRNLGETRIYSVEMNYTCVLPLDSVEMAFSRLSAAAKPHHSLHSSVELTHIELIIPIGSMYGIYMLTFGVY